MNEKLKQVEHLLDKYRRGYLSEDEEKRLDDLITELLQQMERSTPNQRFLQILEEYQFRKYFDEVIGSINHYDPRKVDESAERAWMDFAQKAGFSTRQLMEVPSTPTPRRKRLSFQVGIGIVASLLILIGIGLPFLRHSDAPTDEVVESVEAPIAQSFSSGDLIKRIRLVDGTVVHLNKETTLSIRQGHFNARIREVWLEEGEAFFEVAKDPQRPFIVHTADGLSTKVLGTSFNIKAYAEIAKQVVSVKTGRVQVESTEGKRILLTPDTKVSFDPSTGGLFSAPTDGTADADWRTGQILFTSATRSEVAMRLRQFYGVEMQVRGNALPADMQLDSFFDAHAPLQEFAKRVSLIYQAHYKITDDTILFY